MDMSRSPAEVRAFDKDMEQKESRGVARQLPRYVCHKEVWALKIKSVAPGNGRDIAAIITPEDDGFAPFAVSAEYLKKHRPDAGGYYVVYADGYRSFSPQQAFEAGYIKLEP